MCLFINYTGHMLFHIGHLITTLSYAGGLFIYLFFENYGGIIDAW